MKFHNLSREQKEDLYIEKETKLQRHWRNPIVSDWEYVKEWTDRELEEKIQETIGQLRFEKIWSRLALFVILGILFFVIQVIFN